MRFFISLLVIGFSLSSPLLAKGPPPGTGVGDVKANIMIMLDDSGSMTMHDNAARLDRWSYDVAVANNGDIFVADYMRDKITRLDSSYTIKGVVGGRYSQPNNDANGQALFYDLHAVAMDHGDSTDEFFYAGNTSHQTGRNGFGRSHISKVCTGITVTAQCPKLGKLVAVGNPGSSIGGIAVQGNYVFGIGSAERLYKLDKSNLNTVTSRNIGGSIDQFDNVRSDVAAAGDYVIVSDWHSGGRRACKFNASDLSDATFGNGQHCLSLGFRPQGMAISGKGTASTSDDFIYLWQNHHNETIVKYDADTGNRVGGYIRRGGAAGRTQSSYGIDVGPDGHIYVAERGHSSRKYVSKFDDTPTYVSRGPASGSSQTRMQVAHAAIRAILQDPDLTAGANFGIFSWGSRRDFNIRTPISPQGANDILTRTLAQIRPRGWTELGAALEYVRLTYWHNPVATPIDIGAPCQGNFNLIISDGMYNGSTTPEAQMPLLTNHSTMPVRSFIVGLGNNISGNSNFIRLAEQQYGDTTPPGALFANNVQALTLQLRSAILSAISGQLSFTSPKVDFSSTPNGYICQPSFKYKQEDQWQGLLTRYEIKADGSIDDPQGLDPTKTIRFHELLDDRAADVNAQFGRKIWTVDEGVDNALLLSLNNNFSPDYITDSGLNLVEESTQELMMGGDTHLGPRDVARIMDFMRGHDMFDQDSDCGSASPISLTESCYKEHKGGIGAPLLYKLHDFYSSTPAYIGNPTASASLDVAGTESEYRYLNNYNDFKALQQNRKNIILIGSNGGMLHAFDNGCNVANASCPVSSEPGRELWAFVPPAILKNFQNIVSPQDYTELDAAVNISSSTIIVKNTAMFPSSGILRIGEEFIKYSSKTATTFSALERGHDCLGNAPLCSDATAHATGAIVYNESTIRKPKYSVYAVDGPVVAKDIYTNGNWKTIAMVGFGKGGRGYTALDVTDPDFPKHMFTILNDIRGPGAERSVKVWQTTRNPSTTLYETRLIKHDYAMAIETTSIQALVTAAEVNSLPVADASALTSSGYILVTNPDGEEEIIYYTSKSGNNLQNLIRGMDSTGNSNAMELEAGASVTQDSSCQLATTSVPAEYDYTRLALTTSMPQIANLKIAGQNKWAAVFGGGQNYGKDCTTGDVVYVMDLEDNPGTIIKQIAIPDDPNNSIYNSVNSNLALVQRDGTSKADYYGALVYFADLENKLWKIDLTENAGLEFGRKIKIFEDVATDTNGRRNYQEIVPVLDSSQNINVRFGVEESNILRLYWGTGDMDNLAERTPLVANRLYGISDMTFTSFFLGWQSADDLTNLPAHYSIGNCFDSTLTTSAACPSLNNLGISQNIGWYIDLPESRKTTGRKALYDKEQVYFVVYQPTNVLCSPGDAILGTYGYMCPNEKRLVIALGAGIGTGATTQGSQIYIGVSNAQINGIHDRGDILEQAGSGFGVGGTASAIAQEAATNIKGTDNIIVLSPVGTASTSESSITAWRHYIGENYFDN